MARIKNPLSSSLKRLVKLTQQERVSYRSSFENAASNMEQNAREDFTKRFFQKKFGKFSWDLC